MAEEPNATTLATPAVTPVTTPALAATTPEPLAGEGSETISLEEAKKLRKEAQALRTRLKTFEDTERQQQEAKRAAEEADLGEKERIAKQFQELQSKYEAEVKHRQEITARHDVQKAAEKLNFVYPDLAYAYLKESEFERDDDGNITNAEDLLKGLLKTYKNLAKEESPAVTPVEKTPPNTPVMNPSRPGLSAIPSPNQAPQGTKFVDPGWGAAFQSGPKRQ